MTRAGTTKQEVGTGNPTGATEPLSRAEKSDRQDVRVLFEISIACLFVDAKCLFGSLLDIQLL
ncbi:hypothetical protein, partial [Brachybacterium nesterenkovii]|uniref:hypothetical protein n=1 Tax=Brachybacterium nesterenkovii TaxID=47847 RepID=UPI00321ADE69